MFCHVDPVVTAGVEVELAGNVPRAKHFVQSHGTGVETKIIFRAAIKVDLQSARLAVRARVSGSFCFQKTGSIGEPNTSPENPRPG